VTVSCPKHLGLGSRGSVHCWCSGVTGSPLRAQPPANSCTSRAQQASESARQSSSSTSSINAVTAGSPWCIDPLTQGVHTAPPGHHCTIQPSSCARLTGAAASLPAEALMVTGQPGQASVLSVVMILSCAHPVTRRPCGYFAALRVCAAEAQDWPQRPHDHTHRQGLQVTQPHTAQGAHGIPAAQASSAASGPAHGSSRRPAVGCQQS
jgi:hypothetical protein